MDCGHNYQFYNNVSYWKDIGYRNTTFVSVDYFHCTKCCDIKEVKKEQSFNQGEFENRPDWCRVITKQSYD